MKSIWLHLFFVCDFRIRREETRKVLQEHVQSLKSPVSYTPSFFFSARYASV